jgi:hypothetical protein
VVVADVVAGVAVVVVVVEDEVVPDWVVVVAVLVVVVEVVVVSVVVVLGVVVAASRGRVSFVFFWGLSLRSPEWSSSEMAAAAVRVAVADSRRWRASAICMFLTACMMLMASEVCLLGMGFVGWRFRGSDVGAL